VDYLNRTSDNDTKSSLISVLGDIKNPEDVTVLLTYLNSDEMALQLSALRALTDWPNADPLEAFELILDETEDTRIRALSLRGYTQVILNDDDIVTENKVNALRFGLEKAATESEKKLVISALGKVPALPSLSLLITQMADPGDLRSEIEAAILNIVPDLMEKSREETLSELKRLRDYSDNDEILKYLD
jgi:hypothetical protein